jgi:hypothetical protein
MDQINLLPKNYQRTLLNKDWLDTKSTDELIDIILFLATEVSKKSTATTQFFSKRLENLQFQEVDARPVQAKQFISLPLGTQKNDYITWRITLISTDSANAPLNLEINDEITLGCKGARTYIDLNLTEYGAKDKGVSRLHAAFKPTNGKLYLIDKASTNGTHVGTQKLIPNRPHPINDRDVIAFGNLFFMVRIIGSP